MPIKPASSHFFTKLFPFPTLFRNILIVVIVLISLLAIIRIFFVDYTLYIVIVVVGGLAVFGMPILLTRAPPKPKKDAELVHQLLEDPHSRRRILRYEIGGITAGVIAFAFAAYGLWQTNEQSQLAREALRDQRTWSTWQMLSDPSPVTGGKAYALQQLMEIGEGALYGINVGCKTENEITQEMLTNQYTYLICNPHLTINSLAVGNQEGENHIRELNSSDFSHVEFGNFKANNLTIFNADFSWARFIFSHWMDVSIRKSDFRRADINGRNQSMYDVDRDEKGMLQFIKNNEIIENFDQMDIFNSDFSGARIDVNFNELALSRVNFSYATLMSYADITYIQSVSFAHANLYGWEITLPSDVNIGPIDISGARFCDSNIWGEPCGHQTWDQRFFDNAYFRPGEPPIATPEFLEQYQLNEPCYLVRQDEKADWDYEAKSPVCDTEEWYGVPDITQDGPASFSIFQQGIG